MSGGQCVPGASDLFGPAAGYSIWCAPRREEMGLGSSWEEKKSGMKRCFREWQCARAIVDGDEESASSPSFLAVSERQNNTVLLFAAGKRRQGAGANLRVVFRRSSSLGVAGEDCSTLCRVLSPSAAFSSEPGQLQPDEQLDERAPLFVATGSVCQKAGWRLSTG